MSATEIFRQSLGQNDTQRIVRCIVKPLRLSFLALALLMTSSLCGCSRWHSVSKPPLVQVISAARDLPRGITVQDTDVKIVNIPLSDLPPHSPRRISDVVGHKTLVPISKDGFISQSQVDH